MTAQELIQEAMAGRKPRGGTPVEGLGIAFLTEVLGSYGDGSLDRAQVQRAARMLERRSQDPWNIARAVGVGQMFDGRWSAAADAFHRAGQLAPASLSVVVRIAEVDCISRAGDVTAAVTLGKKIVRQLRSDPVQQARARINLANALEQGDQLRLAMVQYQKAIAALGAEYPADRLKALSGLAWTAAALGHFDVAEDAAREACAGFRKSDQLSLAAVAAGSWALALMSRGRADQGLQLIVDNMDHIPDAQRGWMTLLYGDCLFALNLWEEADRAYARCLDSQATLTIHANAHLGRALASEQLGRGRRYREEWARARRNYTALGNEVMLGWCQLTEAHQATGARKQALARRAYDVLNRNGWKTLASDALVISRPDESLLTGLVRLGAPSIKWKAARQLALRTTGRDRVRWQERMIREILASRQLLESTYARASFLADKAEALSEVLLEWLTSTDKKLWAKARRAIMETRAVTLLDEISGHLGSDQQSRLMEIRAELAQSNDPEQLPPTLRRGSSVTSIPGQLRTWVPVRSILVPRSSAAHIAVQGENHMAWLHPDGSRTLVPLPRADCDAWLDRLRFELFSPLVGCDGDVDACLEVMDQVQALLGVPCGGWPLISPEGALWDFPWQLFAPAEQETSLTLCPALAGSACTLPNTEGVVIWAAAHTQLPHIQRELDALATRFPHATICRTREEALKSLNGSIGLLHVSAHGRHLATNPMFSHIEFPDGVVTAHEVARSAAQIGHAVLLSCESARLTPPNRSEPDGFIRAVLARGCQAAIGSAWLLDDATAFDFQEAFYDGLGQGFTMEHALGRARTLLRQTRPHPFYWGAPVLFRGYCSEPREVRLI